MLWTVACFAALLCGSARAFDEPISCENIKDIQFGRVVAVGARKQVSEAYHGSTPVLVTQPW